MPSEAGPYGAVPTDTLAGVTYEKAHQSGKRGLTIHDVLLKIVRGEGARSEGELQDMIDAIHAHKIGLRGGSEFRMMVDAEQAQNTGEDLSGLSEDDLFDRVAAADPPAIAEFRRRRARAASVAAEARAAMSPAERKAELQKKSEDELYQLALTDPEARVELQGRHLTSDMPAPEEG